jgi:hypothetical protein
MTQIPMFSPGSGGLESLITRRTDPETSRVAARKVVRSGRIGKSLEFFTSMLDIHGPMTVRQAAHITSNPDYWRVEWDKRVKSWHVAGHIELTGEVRDGGRVWRIKEGS